jgi:hypothetical protein
MRNPFAEPTGLASSRWYHFGRRNWRVRRSDLWAWQQAGMKTRPTN